MTDPAAPSNIRYTAQQTAAITHPLRPLLIVAGAGSGKTSVMAARITHTAASVDQRHILGLTFSNKAAAHLRKAVIQELGADSDVAITTYHGFGASIIDRWGARLGLPRRVRLLDHAQALQLLYDVFESTSYTHRKTGRPLGILQDALLLSSRLSDHLVPLDALAADCTRLLADPSVDPFISSAAGKRSELVPLIAQYRQRKLELGLLDHDDQIALAYQLISAHTDVHQHLRDHHRAVLLDEYQDTNFAQRRLLQTIFGTEAAPPVTAVGDDMQSIYGFRGAHLANLHGFVSHFDRESPDTKPLVLGTSFRNDTAILQLANRIQAQVSDAQPKTLLAHDGAGPGTLSRFLAADSWAEARHIAQHVAALIANGTHPAEIAVLCRKKRLIGPLVEALDAASVPAEVIGLGGLLIRPEVIELRCWLEVLGHHQEHRTAVPLLRLLRGPRYRIGLHDLAALAARPRTPQPVRPAGGIEAGLADLAARDLSPEAVDRLTRFVAERSSLREAAQQLALGELIDHILTYTGLWQAVDGDLPAENLARFLHVADQFVPLLGNRSLEEFLNWLSVMEESETDLSEAVQSGADAVQVMTIHQAKGLEFDYVVVPGLAGTGSSQFFPDTTRTDFPPTQGSGLPHWLRTDNDNQHDAPDKQTMSTLRAQSKRKQLDEEWRLFYVAVTRARHGVLFTAAHWYGDTQKPQGPSPFYTWVSEQDDLVHPAVPDEQSSLEPPGTAERRRRQEQAAAQRDADLAAEASAAHAASARSSRSTGSGRRRSPAQLGFSFAAGAPSFGTVGAPRALPVSAFSLLARCARQFHWTHVRPMPQQASAASVVGTRVHSWIEAHGARLQLDQLQPSLFDSSDLTRSDRTGVSPTVGKSADAPTSSSTVSGFGRSFLASRFGLTAPLHIELPITLDGNGLLVRGRIDAVYANQSTGGLHVVDFKTGRMPLDSDPGAPIQLDLYGLAAQARYPDAMTRISSTSALYLDRNGGAPREVAAAWTLERAQGVQQFLNDSVQRVRGGDQQPTTGHWCTRCPYQDLCAEGRAAVRIAQAAADSGPQPEPGPATELDVEVDEVDEVFADPLVTGLQDTLAGQTTDS